jgi:hypothetical protein
MLQAKNIVDGKRTRQSDEKAERNSGCKHQHQSRHYGTFQLSGTGKQHDAALVLLGGWIISKRYSLQPHFVLIV